jgi:diacylglycerol kinase family enzyme
LTEAAGDGRRLAREAVTQKAEMVIAAGGDGTIREVIQELAGTETALGVLPIGTVNDWARETGIPLDVHGACEILVHGRTRRVDLGRVNGHYFLLMVGSGLDGKITQKVEHHPLKRLGVVGYLLASIYSPDRPTFLPPVSHSSAKFTVNGRLPIESKGHHEI